MIKRNGVEIMNARTNNVSVSKVILDIIQNKQYTTVSSISVDVDSEVKDSVNGTIFYKDDLPEKEYSKINSTFEITKETTTQAARRLIGLGKEIVILNFASGKNPGGGFLSGALAQEEDLCRDSLLYACLKSKPQFYNDNVICDNHYYTHGILYSPRVPFIKDEYGKLTINKFFPSVITAPAPCVRNMENPDPKLLFNTLLHRATKILKVAAEHGHKTIVLGAWGSGAYGNDATMVAKMFHQALEVIPVFEHVCFAIYEKDVEKPFLDIFKKEFSS